MEPADLLSSWAELLENGLLKRGLILPHISPSAIAAQDNDATMPGLPTSGALRGHSAGYVGSKEPAVRAGSQCISAPTIGWLGRDQ